MGFLIPGIIGKHPGMMATPAKIRLADALARHNVWPPALCLDAGDSGSYNNTNPQVWWDLSGNNFSFYRGNGSAAEGNDALFNGTIGALTRNEFWYGNNGQWLSSITQIPTWANHFHLNGAKYTLMAWIFFSTTVGPRGIIGNLGGNSANTGFQWSFSNAAAPTHSIEIFSGTADLQKGFSDTNPVVNAWNMVGVSIDENGGPVSFGWSNGKQSGIFDAAYAAPSAGVATLNLQIGSKGNGVHPLLLGDAIACIAAWTGVAYPVTLFNSVFDTMKYRFMGSVYP